MSDFTEIRTYAQTVEDFTTYTEIDPENRVTVTSQEISFSDVNFRGTDTYVYSDKGVDHFDGDFEHLLTAQVSSIDTYALPIVWMLANTVDDKHGMLSSNEDFLLLEFYRGDSGFQFRIQECVNGIEYEDVWTGTSVGTTYYVKILRDESVGSYGRLYCYIYSDSGRTNLLETLQLDLREKEDFRYIYALNTDNNGQLYRASGFVKDLDLQEQAPPDLPTNISPSNGETNVSLTPTLTSSAFSDPDVGDTHAASQWQITTTSGDYSSPVFDSGTDNNNLTSIIVPSGNLDYNTTYYWHVRHQDNQGAWSDYSIETSFTTKIGEEFTADDNTVALWHFNEGSGPTVSDATVHEHDGTIHGATWVSEGLGGSALDFGSSAYVEIPDGTGLDGMEQLTIESWLYLRSYPPDGINPYMPILSKWGTGYKSDDSYKLFILNTGQLLLEVSDGTGPGDSDISLVYSTDMVPLNQWTLVKATWTEGEGIRLFIDDVESTGIPYTIHYPNNVGFNTQTLQDTSQPVWISRDEWSHNFDGIIDEVRISNISRSPANNIPNQPANISPSTGATGITITPTLACSNFLDSDPGDTHAASKWQITTTPGDYSSTVFESYTDPNNLTSVSITAGYLNYNTTYYWHVRHLDNHGAWSDYSIETLFTTGDAPGDTTSPDSVIDLTVSEVTVDTVTLTWTAPGDDGNSGIASQYDIRMSESMITEANWDSATQLTGEPSPNHAGSSEAVQVTQLTEGTTYYFALKTADEVPNWSGLSNVVSATPTADNTPTGPDVVVDLGTVEVTFDNVGTAGVTYTGTTSVNQCGATPSGYQVVGIYTDVSTTAICDPGVTVGIRYNEVPNIDENSLRLFHCEAGTWIDRTTSVDTTNNIVYGRVDSLSWFFIGGQWVWVPGGTSAPVFPSIYIGILAAFGAAAIAYFARRRLVKQK